MSDHVFVIGKIFDAKTFAKSPGFTGNLPTEYEKIKARKSINTIITLMFVILIPLFSFSLLVFNSGKIDTTFYKVKKRYIYLSITSLKIIVKLCLVKLVYVRLYYSYIKVIFLSNTSCLRIISIIYSKKKAPFWFGIILILTRKKLFLFKSIYHIVLKYMFTVHVFFY